MSRIARRTACIVALVAVTAGCGGDLSPGHLRRVARDVPTPTGVELLRESSYQDQDVLEHRFNVVVREYTAHGHCSQLAAAWEQSLRRHGIRFRVETPATTATLWRLSYRSDGADAVINIDYPRCTRPFVYVAKSR